MTRKRPLVHLSLSPDALSRLAEIATRCGETRSGVVERLIRDADMPRPRMAELIEAFDGSATLQVEAIMGLFRPNNVEELITEMPAAFRKRFLEWCFALSRGGPPLGELEHAFAQGFDAVRQWMVATAAETAEDVRTTEEADLRLDEGFPFEDNSVPDKSHELPRKACAHRPLHRPP